MDLALTLTLTLTLTLALTLALTSCRHPPARTPCNASVTPLHARARPDIYTLESLRTLCTCCTYCTRCTSAGVLVLLLAGALAAVPAAFLTTPADVVKTRLQQGGSAARPFCVYVT